MNTYIYCHTNNKLYGICICICISIAYRSCPVGMISTSPAPELFEWPAAEPCWDTDL